MFSASLISRLTLVMEWESLLLTMDWHDLAMWNADWTRHCAVISSSQKHKRVGITSNIKNSTEGRWWRKRRDKVEHREDYVWGRGHGAVSKEQRRCCPSQTHIRILEGTYTVNTHSLKHHFPEKPSFSHMFRAMGEAIIVSGRSSYMLIMVNISQPEVIIPSPSLYSS